MRNSLRYERKLMHTNKRGFLSRSKYARVKMQCRVLGGAFLLLIGVLWLIRPRDAPIHEGIEKKNSLKKAEDSWEERAAHLSTDKVRSRKPESGEGEEALITAGEELTTQGAGNRADTRPPPNIIADGDREKRGKDNNLGSKWEAAVDEEVDEVVGICNRKMYPAEWELRSDQITILVNGFCESRLSLLQRHVQMYSGLAFVDSIYILWGNTSTPADFLDQWTFMSFGAPIYIVRQDSMSLNDRFLPRSYIKTKAVIICDDDITVDLNSLGFALDVWREDQGRIVGFFPRTHAYDPETKSWMYVRHYKSYSIMLTKLMILATEYLYRYTCEMPAGVKEYVDAGMNCEDIAMNFLASSHSGKGPMLVEGKARDWGDPRNSDVKEQQFPESALSNRKDHRKDRGDCITAFDKFWNGMKLQFTHAKASSNLENEIDCEKFGYLINCDKPASSKREARRIVGENVISVALRYAYTTFLASDQFLNASLLLAQSLRSTGTIHDIVLLLDPSSCSPISESHVLYDHYDEVVKVNLSAGPDASNHRGKLSAWLLLDYAKVVYLEVDSLVLANLDHLFQLPEPAAAPRVFMPGKFSTGLLVLKPSNGTYTRLVQSLEKIRALRSWKRQYLLNSFFDGWFQMPAENRLPARYNVPVVFSNQFRPPSWFDLNRLYENFGPLMVVRFGNANLVSKHHEPSSISNNAWCVARFKLFESLGINDLLPLEGNITNWAPTRINSTHQINDMIWPPPPLQVSPMIVSALTFKRSKAREAFVTVLYGTQHPQLSVAGWAESFYHHHSFRSRPKTLLMVLSTLDPDQYREHRSYFDEVRVVEPIIVNGRVAHESFTLLHLWGQTDFDKLVYVAVTSLFVDNCNLLLDYSPFAAVPSLFPPDTFSTQVMSVQPNRQTYNVFKLQLLSYEFYMQPVERFLNAYHSDWYQKSTMHRMSPSYLGNVVFESHLQNSARPWKVLNFDFDWFPDEEANVTRLWRKTLCDLKPGKKPDFVMSLCGAI